MIAKPKAISGCAPGAFGLMLNMSFDELPAHINRLIGEAELHAQSAFAATVEAWRKRHTGPDYVLIGNTFLYPRDTLKEFLQSRVRKMRGTINAKAVL
jgi:hypothetical protein